MIGVQSSPPIAEVTPHTSEFWVAAANGKLLVKKCNSCGEAHFYPRPFCPFCFSADTAWLETSGKGVIYSFTVMGRAPVFQVPAMVKLDDGPTLMTAIVECEFDKLAIGQRVRVDFVPAESGPPCPVFRPE